MGESRAERGIAGGQGAWEEATRGILGGIGHGLNGRLAALGGIHHMARESGLDDELGGMMEEELERLGELTRVIRALAERPRQAEPLRLAEAVDEAAELHAYQRAFEEVPLVVRAGGEDPPVRVCRWRLRVLLLLMMLEAAREARVVRGRVAVEVGGAAGCAKVSLVVEEGGPRGEEERAPLESNLEALARDLGGELTRGTGGEAELRLRPM